MAVDVPGSILKQTDVRETITNTAETSVAFDLDYARFDGSGAILGGRGLCFRPSGWGLFTASSGDDIRQYALTAKYNVNATFGLIHTLDVSAKETDLRGLFFKPDGTKMYTAGDDGDSIDEYDLSIPWLLSTAVYLQELDISGEESEVRGLWFREDGKQVFISGTGSDKIQSYYLSTPWDISSGTVLGEVAFVNPDGISLSRDGMYLFIYSGNDIKRYVMSSVFRLSTATLDSSFTPFPAISAEHFFFTLNGTRLFVGGAGLMQQYSIKRGWR